ncbi:MAG TPA: tetratricopeptide repeat protein, partial [Gaiellaceae bacterium]|nr:tetratricopeptide repeat protein [Gaiellaceae bacterium]
RATIEWSYDLLTPAEQQLFARLSVFAGGCTLVAAEEVCEADLDTLQSLLEKSLLRFSNERFWMLETIREYAVERLACFTEADELVRRHAAYYLRAAEELGPSLRGTDQKHLLDAVDKDLENYRAALAHLEAADENAGLLRLSLALSDYWWLRGRPAEGGSWSLRALERNPEPTLLRADALRAASELDVLAGPIARRQLTEAIALCRRFEDRALLARCLNNLGVVELMDGKLDTAAALLEESAALRRREPGQVGLGRTLGNLANLEMRRENFAEAQRLVKESLELGVDPFDRAIDHSTLGELALKTHDLSSANVWFCEALRGFAALEARQMIARVLVCLADVEVQRADFDRACTLVAAATQWEEGVDAIEDPDFITERDDVLEALRGSLAERDFELAWNQGRSLSLGETLDLALASLD